MKILNRYTDKVIFQDENGTTKETVLNAIKSRADLSDADLSRANLSDADLSRADLSDADLSRANLSDADLSRANLSDADLSDADLSRADLSDADLSDADLSLIKSDMFYKMLFAPKEIPALREELINGRINGSSYSGECACFCGTIAKRLNVDSEKLEITCGIKPDGSSLIERWFLAIQQGNTPENNPIAKITLEWIDEFLMLTQRIRDGKEL